jgi:hypothetical protein
MLSLYRFMIRQNGKAELEPILRYQQIEFPVEGPAKATAEQRETLAKAVADAAKQEARYGQILVATWSAAGGIVAVENMEKRGRADSLTWLI